MLMLNRGFFSLQDNWAPTLVALANLFVNGILDVAFSPVGTWGIPLSTSVVNVAGTAVLLLLLRRRLGRIELRDVASSFARVVVAAAVAGGVAYAVWKPIDAGVGRSTGGQLLSVLPALAAAAAVYLAVCAALRVRELQALLSVVRRLGRR